MKINITKKQMWQIGQFMLAAVAIVLGVTDAGAMGLSMAVATPMPGGGASVTDEPLTNSITDQVAPELLVAEIDKEICKQRPMATPFDQISRQAKSKRTGSFKQEFYSIDSRGLRTTTSKVYTEPTGTAGGYATSSSLQTKLEVVDPGLFEISTTVRVEGVKGYELDGVTASRQDLMLLVINKDVDTGYPVLVAVNGKKIASSASSYISNCVPTIPVASKLIRLGRAASELDAQTAQYADLPTKEEQFCQSFMMQIEQSTWNKLAKKEVDWNFNDVEQNAVYDMRLGMENSFLFGVKGLTYDPIKKSNIYTTGGIWWQAGKDVEYGTTSDDQITETQLVDISKELFTGHSGSKRKILFAGSDLLANLMKVKSEKIVKEPTTVEEFGLQFTSFKTRFGELLVMHHELFDQNGMSREGFVLDPQYLTKATHIPWVRNEIDLKSSGQRNTEAVVITEASCLYLRYPKAHARIVAAKK